MKKKKRGIKTHVLIGETYLCDDEWGTEEIHRGTESSCRVAKIMNAQFGEYRDLRIVPINLEAEAALAKAVKP